MKLKSEVKWRSSVMKEKLFKMGDLNMFKC